MVVRYTCERYRSLGIGPVQFADGVFETADPKAQALVESSLKYPFIKRTVIEEDAVAEPPQDVPAPKQRKKGGRKAPRSFPAGGEA